MEKYINLAIKDFILNKELDIFVASETLRTGIKVEKYKIVEEAIKLYIRKDRLNGKNI